MKGIPPKRDFAFGSKSEKGCKAKGKSEKAKIKQNKSKKIKSWYNKREK